MFKFFFFTSWEPVRPLILVFYLRVRDAFLALCGTIFVLFSISLFILLNFPIFFSILGKWTNHVKDSLQLIKKLKEVEMWDKHPPVNVPRKASINQLESNTTRLGSYYTYTESYLLQFSYIPLRLCRDKADIPPKTRIAYFCIYSTRLLY